MMVSTMDVLRGGVEASVEHDTAVVRLDIESGERFGECALDGRHNAVSIYVCR